MTCRKSGESRDEEGVLLVLGEKKSARFLRLQLANEDLSVLSALLCFSMLVSMSGAREEARSILLNDPGLLRRERERESAHFAFYWISACRMWRAAVMSRLIFRPVGKKKICK